MTRRFVTAVMGLVALGLSATAWAQVVSSTTMSGTPPSDTPAINLGAVGFIDWTAQQTPKITDAAGNPVTSTSFNVTRMYINVIGNISHIIQFRITPDIVRETAVAAATTKGSLVVRLKYGFMQINLTDWTGKWNGSWVRFGVQQTPIIDFLEGIYRYRFQGQIFIERVGQLGSADAGLSMHANMPNNFGDFHFGVYNGEGQNAAEVNNEKSFQIRGTFRPMARTSSIAARGLRITGFYNHDNVMQGQVRNRVVVDGTFEHRWFNAGVDWLQGHDQTFAAGPPAVISPEITRQGWSVWLTPFFKTKGSGPEALIRFDDWTPDTQHKTVAATAPYHELILGFAYWFPHPGGPQTAALMFDMDQKSFPNFANSGATATNRKFILHALFSY